jgi:hypothetical protein
MRLVAHDRLLRKARFIGSRLLKQKLSYRSRSWHPGSSACWYGSDVAAFLAATLFMQKSPVILVALTCATAAIENVVWKSK